MAEFAELEQEVARNKSVIGSAVALINGIADRVDEAVAANDAGDNTKLAGLSNELRADSQALADAVAANTPAPPEPPA